MTLSAAKQSRYPGSAPGTAARVRAEADASKQAGTGGTAGLGGGRSATVGILMVTDDDCGN
jgi:hypothetical protein